MPTWFFMLSVLAAPQVESRVILGNGVACRASPTRSAEAVGALNFDDVRVNDRSDASGNQETWLLVQSSRLRRPCWVLGTLTTTFDRGQPEIALLAVADHVLASSGGRDFPDIVRVHNLFLPGNTTWARGVDVDSSPILSLRRLELVSAVLSTVNFLDARRDPVILAWILLQGQTVRYFEPGGTWQVTRREYEALYERFAETQWAEELLWASARQPRSDDCETTADCRLGRPLQSVATYWVRYPDGRFVTEAVAQAINQLRGLTRCDRYRYEPATPARLEELRGTLEDVPIAQKTPLLALLDDVEAGCP